MPETPVPEVEPLPDGLWERLREQPERAPEHLSLAAAERFAEPAARWAEHALRHHSPAHAAKTARRKHVRLSTVEGAALGLGGALTTVADLGALAWIQGRMVFFIAAAYGYDPSDPMRPAELLALQDVYPSAADARAGLDGAGTPIVAQMVGNRFESDEALTGKLVRLVGRQVAKRTIFRAIPVLASPVNAVSNSRTTGALGSRAIRYYGG